MQTSAQPTTCMSACCTGDCRQGRDCPNRASSARGNFTLLFVLLLSFAGLLAVVGPAIDHSAETAQADAINAAQARDHFITAAQKQCGINAAVIELPDGSMRCALHTGRKTQRVAVVQP